MWSVWMMGGSDKKEIFLLRVYSVRRQRGRGLLDKRGALQMGDNQKTSTTTIIVSIASRPVDSVDCLCISCFTVAKLVFLDVQHLYDRHPPSHFLFPPLLPKSLCQISTYKTLINAHMQIPSIKLIKFQSFIIAKTKSFSFPGNLYAFVSRWVKEEWQELEHQGRR